MNSGPWGELYGQHQRVRLRDPKTVSQDVRGVLRKLVDLKVAEQNAMSLFTDRKNGPAARTWRFADSCNQRLNLKSIPYLKTVSLKVFVTLRRNESYISAFTVELAGEREDGSTLCIAADLQDDGGNPGADRAGTGACAHAALHCHVGPSRETQPVLRVPLPASGPAHVLECVLAQVVPGFEPAKWTDLFPPESRQSRVS